MATMEASPLMAEVLTFLSAAPSAEEILAFEASDELNNRLGALLDKNREGELAAEEKAELAEYLRMDHFVGMLKIKTAQRSSVS
jgi:hypothetical protein